MIVRLSVSRSSRCNIVNTHVVAVHAFVLDTDRARLAPQSPPLAAREARLLVRQVLTAYCAFRSSIHSHETGPFPTLSSPHSLNMDRRQVPSRLTSQPTDDTGPTGRTRQQSLHWPLGPCVVSTISAAAGGPRKTRAARATDCILANRETRLLPGWLRLCGPLLRYSRLVRDNVNQVTQNRAYHAALRARNSLVSGHRTAQGLDPGHGLVSDLFSPEPPHLPSHKSPVMRVRAPRGTHRGGSCVLGWALTGEVARGEARPAPRPSDAAAPRRLCAFV